MTIVKAEKKLISREQAETAVVIMAIGPHGCTFADLSVRLGFATRLVPAVEKVCYSLQQSGLLHLESGQARISESGKEFLCSLLVQA